MLKRVLVTLASTVVALGLFSGVSPASADVEFPTSGDVIKYVFVSNKPINDSIYWYDAYGDGQSFPEDPSQRVRFNNTFVGTDGHTYWSTSRTFTSRSTYQLVGGYISADYENDGSGNNYVRCSTFVNGVQTSFEYAEGRYATAYC
ncbi:hypothetical protein [Williamsia soli]|uniref:hypothetical protein n=1 Tax=Williamsia soli TaxID=364929 RepID=UPI001A9ED2DE|nr:hypothetical protein [Williamsia soli]